MKMKIDKRNNSVVYNDEKHVYWDENDNEKYISVTTLIGKFTPEFDKEFWSGYKALERILSSDVFKIEKKALLEYKKINLEYFKDTHELDENEFLTNKQNVLDEWAETNRLSCERGTRIHAELESKYKSKDEQELKQFGLGGKFKYTHENFDLNVDKAVFPEYLVYYKSKDGKLKIAGQIDLLIKDGNDIYVIDHKTNKKLEDKSFFNQKTKKSQMMIYPMHNIMDCNKQHYALQLSLYAWMLQQLNPDFNIKLLRLMHYDHSGNVTEHDVDYLKTDVERMVKHYKNQQELEKSRNDRKPIEF